MNFVIYLNRAAVTGHLLLFLFVYRMSTRTQEYGLHIDDSYYSTSTADTSPVFSTRVGWGQDSYNIICDLVHPNYFSPSKTLSLQITHYPRDTGIFLSINYLVMAFFLLSACFQLSTEWHDAGNCVKQHLYHSMFPPGDLLAPAYMTINYMRYVEYSISASLMLVIIALLSGITNQETLVCFALLSFTCMLLGWIAEFCLRLANVEDQIETELEKKMDPPIEQLMNFQDKPTAPTPKPKHIHKFPEECKNIGWLAHMLGWVCIVIPWLFVLFRYNSLFSPSGGCTSNTLGAPSPPQWIQIIFVGQGMLFILFGFVQTYQFNYPSDRMRPEIFYITLSLTAKAILGMTVAFNLFI